MNTKIESKLIVTKKTVFEVNSEDLEDFIFSHYGQHYDFVVGEEIGDGSSLTFDVYKESLEDYEKNDLKVFQRTGEGLLLTGIILTDLCNKSVIEPGEYLVYSE